MGGLESTLRKEIDRTSKHIIWYFRVGKRTI
jgi:hypothetical protein